MKNCVPTLLTVVLMIQVLSLDSNIVGNWNCSMKCISDILASEPPMLGALMKSLLVAGF